MSAVDRTLAALLAGLPALAESQLAEVSANDTETSLKTRAVVAAWRGDSLQAARLIAGLVDDPEAQLMLGQLALEEGDHERGLERAERVETMHPGLAATDLLRARCLRALGRRREAAEALTQAARRARDEYEVHVERAELHMELGEVSRAIESWFEAARCAPSVPEPHAHIARVLLRAGAVTRAHAVIAEAMAGAAGRAPLLLEALAECHLVEGNREAANAALDELADRVAPIPDAANRLAELYAAAGNFAQARLHLGSALALAPEHGPTWLTIGRIAEARQQRQGARVAYRRAFAAGIPTAAIRLATLLLEDATSGISEIAEAERLLEDVEAIDELGSAVEHNRILLTVRRHTLHRLGGGKGIDL
jgi:tetratricopeptide (TPR) repeat protein